AAGGLDASRPDLGGQALFQGGDVPGEHGGVDRAVQVRVGLGEAEEDVVLQGLAEEAGHLGGVGGPGGHQEGGGVVYRLAVPAYLAGLAREQAQGHAEEGGRAGADAPGDHGQGAAAQGHVYALDAAARVGVVVGEAGNVQGLEAVGVRLGRVGHVGHGAAEVDFGVLDER